MLDVAGQTPVLHAPMNCYHCNSTLDVRMRLYRTGGRWRELPICDECAQGWGTYDDQFHGGDRRIRELADSRTGAGR
jgi:hypothetical protein